MLVASLTLAAFAVALAWPVPMLLARAHWPARAPAAALALWQGIALAGGIAMIGSLLLYALIPFHRGFLGGLIQFPRYLFAGRLPADTTISNIFALSWALLLAAHLLLSLLMTAARTERQRRRHRALVELLSSPMPDRPGTRLIDHPAPVAYCLPGARTITVLSGGLVALLSPEQLRAVVAHERAHLRQQHHVVLVAFRSWRSALPWFPIATRAQEAVALLVELLADDQARRETGDAVLASAIELVAADDEGLSGSIPGKELSTVPDAGARAVTVRLERLRAPAALPGPAQLLVLVIAGLLPIAAIVLLAAS